MESHLLEADCCLFSLPPLTYVLPLVLLRQQQPVACGQKASRLGASWPGFLGLIWAQSADAAGA